MTKADLQILNNKYDDVVDSLGENHPLAQKAKVDYYTARAKYQRQAQRRKENRRDRHEALTSLGLVKVRGALGGIYYE